MEAKQRPSLIVNPDLFAFRDRASVILFLPKQGKILEVNTVAADLLRRVEEGSAVLSQNETLFKRFEIEGVLVREQLRKAEQDRREEYSPTAATIMPSFQCNFACEYCYSFGGENVESTLSVDVARSIIDIIVRNSERQHLKQVGLGFHGGGEPLLPSLMPYVKEVVEYLKTESFRRGMVPRVSAATNGSIPESYLEWITSNFSRLNISLDGPEDIQNAQRPMKDGLGSFDKVIRTINYLNARKFNYGIRSTITNRSVARMTEIVEFFHKIAPHLKSFHLEPLFECGRCLSTGRKEPSLEEFTKNALSAKGAAEKLGVSVYYSGSNIDGRPTHYFCGAAGDNFYVTPDGNVTTCLEVCREDDARRKIFFIGKFDDQLKRFNFNQSRIAVLKRRRIENIPHCTDCFLKYSCAGDCLAKTYSRSGNIFDSSQNERCQINQVLGKENIFDQLRKKKGISIPS